MQEKTTLEVIASTVEDALSQGLADLGLTAADVSFEVLDSGGKGFLGMGKRQVRVRLTVNGEKNDESPEQVEDKSASPADPEPAPVKKSASTDPKEDEPLLERSEEIINKLLELMHLDAKASARYDDPDREGRQSVYIDVTGKDLGVLIGRRGKTIDAFQRIATLIVSKEMSRWVRVSIDVEGHRNRREQQLRQMAQKIAQQVISSGRKQNLEPMSPYERRIVHMELQNSPDVKTNSIGEDSQRKVVIEPK
ncbi:MAG: KH domain-containing protein [Anaerolineae bacterium]|jgi:spoIIIJ-associated protein|nr:KH domain-containing protein [Anaerolineae bacterium]MBT4311942.1 KH domain-containing protein [Anaerolineae bacterium]MBT4457476.1 KH domain-containing protein [Anaerolineae bacterium]MBT6060391.1 KH domain-containing protein [Anaerolineae bacterium]MBT6321129.1 KH domain-containing protein [Anaerolineae bacterium]